MLTIQGTPLQFDLRFAQDGVLTDHPLIGTNSLTPLGDAIGVVLGSSATSALQSLEPPLDQQFAAFWQSSQTQLSAAVQAALSQAGSVYNFSFNMPQQGILSAAVDLPTGTAVQPPIPAQDLATATQLILEYQLSGFSGSFKVATNSILGSWADPDIDFSFDAVFTVYIVMAQDPRVQPGVLAQIAPTNLNIGGGNFGTSLVLGLAQFLTGINLNSLVANQLSPQTISGSSLLGPLQQLSGPLSTAFNYGFRTLAPVVTPNGLPPAPSGNTVELQLTHPVDPAPTVATNLPPEPIFQNQPWITASPNDVVAGNPLTVSGSGFPQIQVNQLTFQWTDTTSGSVMQSLVNWGQSAVQGAPPVNPTTVSITRNGQYDGNNHFTTPATLQPNTWYAFQVQDFDVYFPPVITIGTPLTDWVYLQTGQTNQVQLVLYGPTGSGENPTTTPLGSVTLQDGGVLPQSGFQIPSGTAAGSYYVQAFLDGQQLAECAIVVAAAGATIPAKLQIMGFGAGPAPYVSPGNPVSVLGFYFEPGQVNLSVGSAAGQFLGSATVPVGSADGSFTTSVVWPGQGADADPGWFDVYAQENGVSTSAPVYCVGLIQ